jgi:Protein of unknown function (DUF565)
MQNTRLNTLFDVVGDRLNQWVRNPWRRISLIILSLLLGNFLATAFSTIAGQTADLDVVAAMFLVLLTEAISWITYGSRLAKSGSATVKQRALWSEILNGLKLGMIYGLFVEAFKLGS